MRSFEVRTERREEQPTAVATATRDVSEIRPWLASAYGAVAAFLASRGLAPLGAPFARYHRVGEGRFQVEAGFPVKTPVQGDGEVVASKLPGGLVATTILVGPYDSIGLAYEAVTSWVDEHGGQAIGDPWEVYLSDPHTEPDPADWKTEIDQLYEILPAGN